MAPAKSRTRSGAKAAPKTIAEAAAAVSSTCQKTSLSKESSNPPKLFILPKDVSADARIITLQNPRTLSSSRYLCCPQKGFFEFTKVGAPKTTPRSFLISSPEVPSSAATTDAEPDLSKGYITKSSDLFIATLIDPVFLLLPALVPTPTKNASKLSKQHFVPLDDHLDELTAQSPHLSPLLADHPSIRSLFETRLSAICDHVEGGFENMYRLSPKLLFDVVWAKAMAMTAVGLPPSMEEKLVRKALEVPMLSLKRGESSQHDFLAEEGDEKTPATKSDSQSSTETNATELSDAHTAITSVDGDAEAKVSEVADKPASEVDAPPGIALLLRLRVAFNFIFSSYLPPYLVTVLQPIFQSEEFLKLHDFKALDEHMAHLAQLRRRAIESRETNAFTRKRGFEDELDAESRAEKKRKKEEEEKKAKAGMSRGVRDLKKVNVTGMKKMSDFFKKK